MIPEKFTYLLVNLASLSIPLAFSFEHRISFFGQWKRWLPAILITGFVFIVWDVFFTEWGVWGFNERHLLGVYLFGLPLEEWMFFFCIPYACLFSYTAFQHLFPGEINQGRSSWVTAFLTGILLAFAVFNMEKAYTFTTFFLLSMALIAHLLVIKGKYLGRFYLTYLFILIPFFLVNGILTGSFIEEEVVWYNNQENLGIRMFTIPVEDTFYGMLLILGNVTLYEYFKHRASLND